MTSFSNPEYVLETVGISPGSVVVDLGAGTGFYSIAACRMTGGDGRVYAVDVQKELLERLKDAAVREGHDQLEIIWGDFEHYGGTRLRDATAEVVLLTNTLFQLEDKKGAIQEAQRLLKPNGRLVVVDWSDSHFGMGPDQNLIVTQDEAQALLEKLGMNIDSTISAGEHHWGLVARNNKQH